MSGTASKPSKTGPSLTTTTLRVLTVNTHKGFSSFNRRFILHDLREAVREVGADVVFLQEVQGVHRAHARRFADYPQAPHYEFLADQIWSDFAYGRNAIYPLGDQGNAVLSKFPIISYQNWDISIRGPERRGMLHCVLDLPHIERQLHVVCVHLGQREGHRRRQPIGRRGELVRRRWIAGNKVSLLENREAFFPRILETVDAARTEILLETFILFEDSVGNALDKSLLAAAKRGVRIDVLVDGCGSPDPSQTFVDSLTGLGVRFKVVDPMPRLFGWRLNVWRKMHRKLVVIDGERAFIGGINFSADHLGDFGPRSRQDYSAEVEGPVMGTMLQFARDAAGVTQPASRWLGRPIAEVPAPAGEAEAMLVTRDTHRHRDDIERHYRVALRSARPRVTIANAYFFASDRLIRQLRKAATRGVAVVLILQGKPDMPIARSAASTLYEELMRAGVQIHEYRGRPWHGKVAIVEGEWATIGSSNLDPTSLSLNLEAHIVVRDRAFNRPLSERLQSLIDNECRRIEADELEPSPAGRCCAMRSFSTFCAISRAGHRAFHL